VADRVVAWFVPAVLAIAAAALLVWGLVAGNWAMAIDATVAVLVVACPCAVGLATPAAVLVGSGRGAEQGILIKDARALETAGRLTTVVLDKTGTVTQGRPKVTVVSPVAGVAAEELLAVAAAAERLSQHPLAEAVVAEAEARRITVPQADGLEVIAGQGIRVRLGRQRILVGTEQLLASQGIEVDDRTRHAPRDAGSHAEREEYDAGPHAEREEYVRLRDEGQTLLWVALDDRLLGLLCLADPVSPNSREAVRQLKAMGLGVQLLSGDHRRAAEAVARQVGIETVAAEVRPDEKQQVIRRLQQAGQVVAMVGDGINDAPALAAADLGIAIGRGSDVAIEAADVVLVGADLRGVVRAIALSRATLRTIRQNLAWAMGYNLLLIPLAAGVLAPIGVRLPPAAAAAAMAASSVSVVANSLLLRRRRI
jgi:Cu+-exporting ATPase